jgi:restriction endonuclease S subunit
LLNLDQVEAESGAVLSRRQVKVADVPASTVAFDDTHVLYSKLRPNLNKVVLPCATGYCTSELLPLKPDPRRLDRGYLARYLRSTAFVAWAVSRTDGAKMPRVKMDALREHCIPLPELATQQRIAAILDKADAIQIKRREAIKLADDFLRSAYLEMFGDPLRDDGRSELLGQICSIVRGSSPRPQGDPRYFGGPVPRLMVADLTRDGWCVTPQIDSLTIEGAKRSRPVEAGTIVMAVSGNVGVVARLKIDACIHDGFIALNALDVTRVDPNYLLYCLHMLKASHEKRKAGAIFQNLTTNDIKNMPVPLPSIEQQAKFGKVFEKFLTMSTKFAGLASETEALFESLTQRAFSGQL